MIAVAGTKYNPEWIRDAGTKVEVMVYQQEDANRPHFYTDRGNEAGAYLTFMVDYYNCLPEVGCPNEIKDQVPDIAIFQASPEHCSSWSLSFGH